MEFKEEEKSNFEKFKRPGRPKRLSETESANLVLDYYTFPVSLRELARKYNVSTMTVRRVVQNMAFVHSVLNL